MFLLEVVVFILCIIFNFTSTSQTNRPTALTTTSAPSTQASIPMQTAGYSVEKRPVEFLILGDGPDVVFIMAGVHGDEKAGVGLAYRLAQYVKEHPKLLKNKKLLLLPLANPDGFAKNTRQNARGVDLNRNFSTSNRKNSARFGPSGLSEPESCIIKELLDHYKPSVLSVIVPPTPIEAVKEISLAGQLMPQKSTFFYPKLATGLVINPLFD